MPATTISHDLSSPLSQLFMTAATTRPRTHVPFFYYLCQLWSSIDCGTNTFSYLPICFFIPPSSLPLYIFRRPTPPPPHRTTHCATSLSLSRLVFLSFCIHFFSVVVTVITSFCTPSSITHISWRSPCIFVCTSLPLVSSAFIFTFFLYPHFHILSFLCHPLLRFYGRL